MNDVRLYNSPQEVGVRILFILDICNKQMSKQRIMYYDYFALHLNDLDISKSSLHPDNPKHSSEIAIKQELINSGLNFIIAKDLISVKYSKTGIYYCANPLTHSFVELFQNDYTNELKQSISLVNSFFSYRSDKQIFKYINQNIGKWIGEFEHTSNGGE